EFGYNTIKPFFRGKKALELGPASGFMTKNLVNDFEKLDLIEGSNELLDQIPNYENVIKTHSLFEDFETTELYDTIIMAHVLEHIENPVAILEKVHSWLSDSGVFIVSVPNAKSLHRLAAVKMGLLTSEYQLNSRDHQLGHYRVYDLETLENHAKEANFQILNKGGYFLKPISNGQIDNHWDESMIEAFYNLGFDFEENCAEIYLVCQKVTN
ncbi:class I SAM-dependent methyltransferase, partial [Bacteroidia bacterium]|nr:class I SAM-dependent methyltransferase [Bacteroidia bacterium]